VQKIISFVAGYVVSTVVGYVIISFVDKKLSKIYRVGRPGWTGLPAWVGVCERILYTSVWLAGFKEFIAWWLLIKVGAGWILQVRQQQSQGKEAAISRQELLLVPPRLGVPGAIYNIFFILNALSILFGVFGALIILRWPWILECFLYPR